MILNAAMRAGDILHKRRGIDAPFVAIFRLTVNAMFILKPNSVATMLILKKRTTDRNEEAVLNLCLGHFRHIIYGM